MGDKYNGGAPMCLSLYRRLMSEQLQVHQDFFRAYILDVTRCHRNLSWDEFRLQILIEIREDSKVNVKSIQIERLKKKPKDGTQWGLRVREWKKKIRKWNESADKWEKEHQQGSSRYGGVGIVVIAFEALKAKSKTRFEFQLELPFLKSELEGDGEMPILDQEWARELADWLSDDLPTGGFIFSDDLPEYTLPTIRASPC